MSTGGGWNGARDRTGTPVERATRPSPFTKVAAGAGVIVLAGLSCLAFAWGLADALGARAQWSIAEWQKAGSAPPQAEWESARWALDMAIWLDGSRPELLEAKGRLHEWRNLSPDRSDPDALAGLGKALEYYRHAASQRPAWPFTWAHVALVKHRLGELDIELDEALRNAAALGPWEPIVQRTIAEIGWAGWDQMTDKRRELMLGNLDRGLAVQPAEILTLTQRWKRLAVLCEHFGEMPGPTEERCRERESASTDDPHR